MAEIRPRDLLSEGLLARLGRTGTGDAEVARTVARDIAKLGAVGYLNVALPPEFGGLGCTLRQAACGQRRLARYAPRTAMAVSAHLYWTGAAADAYRSGDDSVRWIILEAARGALFAAGHGEPGSDLKFADPHSRCEPAGEMGYRFRTRGLLSGVTPAWDWMAVHGITGDQQPDAVLAFAGRGTRCTPAFRVARVLPAGAPSDVFTASAVTWGNSILASVQYSHARNAFNDAVVALDRRHDASAGHPLDQWPVAEASLRLDAMKAKIAEITHPWPLIPEPVPDLGGQRLIGLYTMRHEVADGAAHVHALIEAMSAARPVAAV
ncbi:MAG: acyl-CoA/acyl-ACP dehydrogenase [Nocardiopsaceae bacterium]|nr:acyl-CoA/acyl-ACP dehydrogenase [Nocardiopsaceae bacterium]